MAKIGVIIPTRRDRPKFLDNCLKLINSQTLKPEIIEVVDYEPKSQEVDITPRYRYGYYKLQGLGLDFIAFMEEDDYYSPDYLETMYNEWIMQGRPDMLGTSYTIYYHIKLFAHFTMEHHTRSSMMSTIIKPDLKLTWPLDTDPYTDMWLWNNNKHLSQRIFVPSKHICLGIKHGVGKCGGGSHTTRLDRYLTNKGKNDFTKDFLQSVTGDSFEFYNTYFNEN